MICAARTRGRKQASLRPAQLGIHASRSPRAKPCFAYYARLAHTTLSTKQKGPRSGPFLFGGEGGIRTHGGLSPSLVFKTSAFNSSATSPCAAGSIAARAHGSAYS